MELKITSEKVLEASSKCSTAKEILKTLFPEAFKEKEFDWKKIYIYYDGYSNMYKLHKGGDETYSFIRLQDSDCHASGFHKTATEALEGYEDKVKIFDSLKEFLKWASETTK